MARLFNGSTDQINTAVNIPNTSALSMAGWALATSLPNAYQCAFSLANNGTSYFIIYIKSGGTLASYTNAAAANVNLDPWTSGTFSTGVWNHLAITGLSGGGNLVGYLNGVQQFSIGSGIGSGPSLSMGMGYDVAGTAGRQWNGSVADVAVWNVQLTPTEIATLASGTRAKNVETAALAGYWPLICQSPEPDLSGNGNPGVLTGTSCTSDPPQLPPLNPVTFMTAGMGLGFM